MKILKWLTKAYTSVPLLWIDFNLEKYITNGAKGSCVVKVHPDLKDDNELKCKLNEIVDYIRENYDMERLSK